MAQDNRRQTRRIRALVRKHQRVSDRIVEAKAALGEGFVYDPMVAPHPENWLAVEEGEGLALVRAYHKQAGLRLATQAQDNLHAAVHAIVENQLAMDVEGRREQLASLMAGGMDRHEAVHEIGRGLMGQIYNAAKGLA